MATLNNVKEIILKGKHIRDVDITSINLPTPVYENGEIKRDSQTHEIIYEPPLNTLKSNTLLTETSLPIAYSLEDKTLDPASQDFKNEIMTLAAATELKTLVKEDPLQILPNNQYKFGNNEPENFGPNQNHDALSVGNFKNTLTSGIEFSKEHNNEISNNFMTEKVFKDRYVSDKLIFTDDLSVPFTDGKEHKIIKYTIKNISGNYNTCNYFTSTEPAYFKLPLHYSSSDTGITTFKNLSFKVNEDSTIFEVRPYRTSSYVYCIMVVKENYNSIIRLRIDGNNNNLIFDYNLDTKQCTYKINNVNQTLTETVDNNKYSYIFNDNSFEIEYETTKIIKFNYIINNHKLGEFILYYINNVSDDDIPFKIDVNYYCYTDLTNDNYIEYKEIINLIGNEIYNSSDSNKYTQNVELNKLHSPINESFVFSTNQGIKTYILQDESNMETSDYNFETEHKLLTTNALKDAYVNELNIKNQEWYDENKYKLVTVEAMEDVETETEKEHLQIANVNGTNKYQFGNGNAENFDTAETSTKPLSVNVLADTKTVPFEFSKTETFGNNLMTEKVLENTYINDKLLFSKTLTNNENNTEISGKTIDPEIEHKLVTTDALKDAYVNELNIKNQEWVNENKYKFLTVEAIKDLKFDNVDFDNMILLSKYDCEIIEDSPNNITSLYDTTNFNYKINGNNIKIYYDYKLIYNNDVSSTFNNANITYNNGSCLNSYRVVDKYYGLLFDIYEMNNEFDINIRNGDIIVVTEQLTVKQYLAILRNGTQINNRKLNIAAILKYCDVAFNDTTKADKKMFIILYTGNTEFTFNADEILISDDLTINTGDEFIINLNQTPENIQYDDNEYTHNVVTSKHVFTKQ